MSSTGPPAAVGSLIDRGGESSPGADRAMGAIGFRSEPGGHRLVAWSPDGAVHVSGLGGTARRRELLACAIVHFEEALLPPPPEWEATQEDLRGLVAWLADTGEPAVRDALGDALEAVDDGLSGDAVARSLIAASRLEPAEDQDPASLLAERYRALTDPGR